MTMAIVTITEPSADEVQKLLYRTRMRRANHVTLATEQKFACVVLSLAPAVTQVDYPALKAAIEAIAGIQEVQLLLDGQMPASIPADTELRFQMQGDVTIEDTITP